MVAKEKVSRKRYQFSEVTQALMYETKFMTYGYIRSLKAYNICCKGLVRTSAVFTIICKFIIRNLRTYDLNRKTLHIITIDILSVTQCDNSSENMIYSTKNNPGSYFQTAKIVMHIVYVRCDEV